MVSKGLNNKTKFNVLSKSERSGRKHAYLQNKTQPGGFIKNKKNTRNANQIKLCARGQNVDLCQRFIANRQ